jgi:hypothetical protein
MMIVNATNYGEEQTHDALEINTDRFILVTSNRTITNAYHVETEQELIATMHQAFKREELLMTVFFKGDMLDFGQYKQYAKKALKGLSMKELAKFFGIIP